MLAAIDAAREAVWLQVYAFAYDGVGQRFIASLTAAARRGVQVDVEIDGWGSLGASAHVVADLRAGGCRARVFNRIRLRSLFRIGRNHRKLLVVDDRVVLVGGVNIGDRYADWCDVAVEARGRVAHSVGRRLRGERYVAQPGPTRVHLSPLGGGRRLYRQYVKAFGAARKRLWVAHGYFFPSPRLIRRLISAARRGVDVALLVPGRSDLPLVRLATAVALAPLRAAGVRIYECRSTILHAKMAVIDGERLLVGSFNLDPFSMANLEALVITDEESAARSAERWLAGQLLAARSTGSVERADSRFGHLIGVFVLWLVRVLARLMLRAPPEQNRAERFEGESGRRKADSAAGPTAPSGTITPVFR